MARDIILVLFHACAAGQENPTLTVTGEGTVTVPADAVTIIATVEGENENPTLAEERAQDEDIFCVPSHVMNIGDDYYYLRGCSNCRSKKSSSVNPFLFFSSFKSAESNDLLGMRLLKCWLLRRSEQYWLE